MALAFTRTVRDNSGGIPNVDLAVRAAGRVFTQGALDPSAQTKPGLEQHLTTEFVFGNIVGGVAPYFFDLSGVQAAAYLEELVAADTWENRLAAFELTGSLEGAAEGASAVVRAKIVPTPIIHGYVSWAVKGEIYIAPGSYVTITDGAGTVTVVSFGNNDDFGDAPVAGVAGFVRRISITADEIIADDISALGYSAAAAFCIQTSIFNAVWPLTSPVVTSGALPPTGTLEIHDEGSHWELWVCVEPDAPGDWTSNVRLFDAIGQQIDITVHIQTV